MILDSAPITTATAPAAIQAIVPTAIRVTTFLILLAMVKA
jgi:hypothetical protein